MGRGSVVGEALTASPLVAGISFTGSVATGGAVARACVERGARVQLEMGGKNPLVVLDDADLDVAVNCALQGAYFSTGQRCTASSRLIVTAGIHDRFVDALTRRLAALAVDDALKPGTEIGPVVDQAQLDQDVSYLDIGRDEGGELVFGGNRLDARARRLLPGARPLRRHDQRDAPEPRGGLRAGRRGAEGRRLRARRRPRQRHRVRPRLRRRHDVADGTRATSSAAPRPAW